MPVSRSDLESLPGAEIVLAGVSDVESGRATVEAAAVSVIAERLRRAGIDVPAAAPREGEPGHHLYELLVDAGELDPHSRYNAILRRIDSFARAMERATPR